MHSPSNHQRDVETDAIERKTRSFTLSPERMVQAKAGVMWAALCTIVGCAITCTAYVVRMEGKVDQSLELGKQTAAALEKIAPEHAILWDWYNRTASRGSRGQVGP